MWTFLFVAQSSLPLALHQRTSGLGGKRSRIESPHVMKENLQKNGKVRLPGILAAKAVVKPAKPASRKMVMGKPCDIPEMPSVKIVRLVPCKDLRVLQ